MASGNWDRVMELSFLFLSCGSSSSWWHPYLREEEEEAEATVAASSVDFSSVATSSSVAMTEMRKKITEQLLDPITHEMSECPGLLDPCGHPLDYESYKNLLEYSNKGVGSFSCPICRRPAHKWIPNYPLSAIREVVVAQDYDEVPQPLPMDENRKKDNGSTLLPNHRLRGCGSSSKRGGDGRHDLRYKKPRRAAFLVKHHEVFTRREPRIPLW